MDINKIYCENCLETMAKMPDCSIDIIFTDPPYALGSEIIIRQDGKPDYKKAVDFMNKWQMPGGDWWEQWFREAFRVLKYGGRCLMFSIDRQTFLFKYYANLAQFTESQSIYWYFISSFPKATDLSKTIDKHFDAEREITGIKSYPREGTTPVTRKATSIMSNNEIQTKNIGQNSNIITAPSTDLAKKYDGHKYSCAPLKQTVETIMVFQKPYKKGSCLHDILAMEGGDNTITCVAVDIDGNRVPTEIKKSNGSGNKSLFVSKEKDDYFFDINEGRYPSQSFVDSGAAEILDKQSGISKSTGGNGSKFKKESRNALSKNSLDNQIKDSVNGIGLGDSGGCSKILHKCDYEDGEFDLYMYCPKVSQAERNEGCEKLSNYEINRYGKGIGRSEKSKNLPVIEKNSHPTVKPISLAEKVIGLFKTPNKQTMIDPFMGSGSLIIGANNKGFDTIGIELNPEYYDIAQARIEHYGKKKKSKDSQLKLF